MGIIEQAIWEELGFSLSDICSRNKTRNVCDARFIWAWLMVNEVPDTTYSTISVIIGRDHSSISHYITRYNDLYATDSKFRDKAQRVRANIDRQRGVIEEYEAEMWVCLNPNGSPLWRSISETRIGAEQWVMENFSRTIKKAKISLTLQ